VNAEYDETRALMGDDYWSYGLNEQNRRTLEAMARYSFEQGLAVRLLSVDEMFAESTLGGDTRV
jgi:4,5-dihydroxyphthalate decarboxylase